MEPWPNIRHLPFLLVRDPSHVCVGSSSSAFTPATRPQYSGNSSAISTNSQRRIFLCQLCRHWGGGGGGSPSPTWIPGVPSMLFLPTTGSRLAIRAEDNNTTPTCYRLTCSSLQRESVSSCLSLSDNTCCFYGSSILRRNL